MTKIEMTEEIILAKKSKGLSWEDIAGKVGLSPVFLTSACLGTNSLKPKAATKLCKVLGLSGDVLATIQEYPMKTWDFGIPQDPFVYRFYEITGVYGETMKEIVQEKFGDGIMSAIDFSLDIDKEEDPKGDRVVITMNGKFLPYKSW
ncbi:cyanase [Sulfurimonas aquatica]|uniref:Cyanate hydratase n=1 Tax=Sulfurimonas aquatica TaxID=2672570 RepID=A0A975GCT7_9BACT|nr:cyanase [Sulfurimonas aquatica]QSZ41619.1 cyanase [Sulfurimonas aquatica]